MAFAGLIFIGLLFGVILGGGVVAFIVVRAGGPLKESLFGDDARKPAFKGAIPGPEATPEPDTRQKALLEELRITQKLLDQGRGEREEHDKAVKAAAEEMAVVRNQIADRDVRIQALEGSLREATLRVDNALAQLSERTEELAKVSLQLKDARLELDVTESGSTVTSSQISQLQRERDELAALVEQLRPRRQVSRPFA
jgi:chromosome segregation ATPase